MSDEMIDNLMAGESQAEAPETQVETDSAPENQEAEKPQDPWPKAAENALSRAKRNTAKYKAQYQELQARHSDLEARLAKLENPAPKEPREEDYDTYGDFIKAYARFNPNGAQNEQPQEKPLSRDEAIQQAREQLELQKRIDDSSKIADKLMAEVPEYKAMYAEYSDIFEDIPVGTRHALLSLENPPAAFYALAKEGLIEQLPNLPPMQATIVLARAEVRGEQMIAARKSHTTKAPTPMKGVNGSGSSKSMSDMTPDEIIKKYIK